MACGRLEIARIQFFGESEKRSRFMHKVVNFEDGRRIWKFVFLQIVVQASSGRSKIRNAGGCLCDAVKRKNMYSVSASALWLSTVYLHVEIPAPTIVTIRLKPPAFQCANKPSMFTVFKTRPFRNFGSAFFSSFCFG